MGDIEKQKCLTLKRLDPSKILCTNNRIRSMYQEMRILDQKCTLQMKRNRKTWKPPEQCMWVMFERKTMNEWMDIFKYTFYRITVIINRLDGDYPICQKITFYDMMCTFRAIYVLGRFLEHSVLSLNLWCSMCCTCRLLFDRFCANFENLQI